MSDETPTQGQQTEPVPSPTTPDPKLMPFGTTLPTALTKHFGQFYDWLLDEVHPQYGGGKFERADTLYWLSRFVNVWNTLDVPSDDQDRRRYLFVQREILSEYRIYGVRGALRLREPKTETPTSVVLGSPAATGAITKPLFVLPPRAIGEFQGGPTLQCGVDDRRLLRIWKDKQADAESRLARHVELGYTWIRVLAHQWSRGTMLSKNDPGHLARMVALTKYAASLGARIHWVLVGDRTGGLEKVDLVAQYVRAAAAALKECVAGVALVQIAEERQGLTDAQLRDMEKSMRLSLPSTLIALTDAEDQEHARTLGGDVALPSLDSNTTRGEGRDRPWKEPFAWSQFPLPWVAWGQGGPGLVPNYATDAEILRSHRLAAFFSGAAVAIYQSLELASGDPLNEPAYLRCGAKGVLTNAAGNLSELPNGSPVKDPSLALPGAATRLTSGTGALAMLSRQVPDVECYYLVGLDGTVVLDILKAGTATIYDPSRWVKLGDQVLDPAASRTLVIGKAGQFTADLLIMVTR